jgi:peptidoglycan/LPS O-acetylase OafA/YrhL
MTTPDSNSRVQAGYIPQITGVRAIAAYMVYIHHFPIGAQYLPAPLYRIMQEFHVGVGLFFVLSGFLIYQRYFDSCQMERGWWGNYTKNRVARIYPMYFLLTVLTLANRLVRHGDAGVGLWFLNLSFLRGFSEEYYMSGISQGWTLTVEECFYFSAPLLFWWMKRVGHERLFTGFWLPMLCVYAAGGVLLGLGTALGAASETVGIHTHGFFQGVGFMFSYTYFGRCFEFFCGMWLARWMAERKLYAAEARSHAVWTWSAIAGIIAVLWAMSLLQGSTSNGMPHESHYEYRYGVQHPLGKLLNNFALPPFYAMLFYGLITERGMVRSLLASRVMVLFGKSSYIYYLIHMGIVQALVARVACLTTFAPATLTEHAVQFVLLNAVAIALFLFVEDPLNHFIRKHWRLGANNQEAAPQAA